MELAINFYCHLYIDIEFPKLYFVGFWDYLYFLLHYGYTSGKNIPKKIAGAYAPAIFFTDVMRSYTHGDYEAFSTYPRALKTTLHSSSSFDLSIRFFSFLYVMSFLFMR